MQYTCPARVQLDFCDCSECMHLKTAKDRHREDPLIEIGRLAVIVMHTWEGYQRGDDDATEQLHTYEEASDKMDELIEALDD